MRWRESIVACWLWSFFSSALNGMVSHDEHAFRAVGDSEVPFEHLRGAVRVVCCMWTSAFGPWGGTRGAQTLAVMNLSSLTGLAFKFSLRLAQSSPGPSNPPTVHCQHHDPTGRALPTAGRAHWHYFGANFKFGRQYPPTGSGNDATGSAQPGRRPGASSL